MANPAPLQVETPGSSACPPHLPPQISSVVKPRPAAELSYTVVQVVGCAAHNGLTCLGRKGNTRELHKITSFLKEIYPQKVAAREISQLLVLMKGDGTSFHQEKALVHARDTLLSPWV